LLIANESNHLPFEHATNVALKHDLLTATACQCMRAGAEGITLLKWLQTQHALDVNEPSVFPMPLLQQAETRVPVEWKQPEGWQAPKRLANVDVNMRSAAEGLVVIARAAQRNDAKMVELLLKVLVVWFAN
jgi:hypothetical protein